MKAMVCEMCGGNDLVKTEGMYVCQSCGTKYAPEEARKLIVELTGSVRVDGIASTDNLLDRAQEFLDKGDEARASEYITRALDIDVHNVRARKLQQDIEEREKQRQAEDARRWLGDIEVTREQYREVIRVLREEGKIVAIKQVRDLTGWGLRETKDYVEQILMPVAGVSDADLKKSSGGCYVATAVYGSYDCPEVWTLRRFRDHRLAQTRCGRLFIRAYYATSPTLVRVFGKTALFGKLLRGPLDALVARCKAQGFADTPYED